MGQGVNHRESQVIGLLLLDTVGEAHLTEAVETDIKIVLGPVFNFLCKENVSVT